MFRNYDERPGFESYNMMNFGYPQGPMMMPVTPSMSSCNNQNDNTFNSIQKQIDSLNNRITRLENNMYPQAVDYNNYPKASYQNSMNMM